MVEASDRDTIISKRKAIYAAFPYAIYLVRGEKRAMLDVILSALAAPTSLRFAWEPIRPYITSLFDEPNNLSLDRVITLVSPYIRWGEWQNSEQMVDRWVSALTAVGDTKGIGQSVVDALLQIAYFDQLRPHITVDVWAWLKKRPSLPPTCDGRFLGTVGDIVRHIRGLGDIEILKSYFLLVWSEWGVIWESGLNEMAISIREDFGGIGMFIHRGDLAERLDCVLGQLDQGSRYLEQHMPSVCGIRRSKGVYVNLKEVLMEVDRRAMENLTRLYFKLIHSGKYTDPMDMRRISCDLLLRSTSSMSLI